MIRVILGKMLPGKKDRVMTTIACGFDGVNYGNVALSGLPVDIGRSRLSASIGRIATM
jgi:hypothetical protein